MKLILINWGTYQLVVGGLNFPQVDCIIKQNVMSKISLLFAQ